MSQNDLIVKNLSVSYGTAMGLKPVVFDVSFKVPAGKCVGLVGESGSGKSTIGKAILRLGGVTQGKVEWRGKNISELTEKNFRPLRSELQMIFQDPFATLNPRLTVESALSEALRQHPDFKRASKAVVQKQCLELLDLVGLSSESLQKYSHEFSGGQCQRIGIARSLAVQPKFIVCDEVVSALDVSVQAQILNLLKDLQKERNLSYLFITHDLGVVRYLCDSVVVLEKGKVVEQNQTEMLFENPQQIYTQNLLKAVPRI